MQSKEENCSATTAELGCFQWLNSGSLCTLLGAFVGSSRRRKKKKENEPHYFMLSEEKGSYHLLLSEEGPHHLPLSKEKGPHHLLLSEEKRPKGPHHLLLSESNLNFDLHNMFVSNEMEEFNHLPNMPGGKHKHIPYGGPHFKFDEEKHTKLFDRVRHEFVRRVDEHMQHYQHAKMTSLRVDFLLGSEHNDAIDQWIGRAIVKGVERIELLFSHMNMPDNMPKLDPYRFPHTLFSEFKGHLRIQNCHLLPRAKFSGFKQLKTLVLEELEVEKDLLLCLFSKSFHLEDLSFFRCKFKDIVNTIKSPTLRHLKIILCYIPRRSKIDIVTPNLSSLEYNCHNNLVSSSVDAPLISELYLNLDSYWKNSVEFEIPHAFDILASFHLLHSLSMVLSSSQVERFPPTIVPFQHLREMELFLRCHDDINDHFWVLNLVMACPRLQKLSFGVSCPLLVPNQRPRRVHPGFSHNELKYVELHGCVGQMIEIELAIHFLKNVNPLECITFGPRSRTYLGNGRWFDGFVSSHWFETGQNLIREQLQDHVNGITQLIFLQD